MYYYYCPKCGFEEIISKMTLLSKANVKSNVRNGYGTPIYHYKCSRCGNPYAGCILQIDGDMDEKVYYRSIIGLYQDIKGGN